MQRSNDLYVDIVVADDVSGRKTRTKLIEFQKQTKDFYLDFIDKWFSSQFIGFNHALSLFKNRHYDYYAYCASDASFRNKDDLRILLADMNKDCCFILPQSDSDMNQRFDFDIKKPPTRIRLGEAVPLHIGIFTREFMEAYDFKYIDILGGPRNEGFYPYLCAAIKRHQYLSHRVSIHHLKAKDRCTNQPLLAPQYKRDFFEMLRKGQKLGLGFEECLRDISIYWNIFLNEPNWARFQTLIVKIIVLNPFSLALFDFLDRIGMPSKKINDLISKATDKRYYYKHNPDCFDENEYAKSEELYLFIKESLFLRKIELDYTKISYQLLSPD